MFQVLEPALIDIRFEGGIPAGMRIARAGCMEKPYAYLSDLRAHASEARRDSTELQRLLVAKMRDSGPISQQELFAAHAIMRLAAAAQSLYLSEVTRCHSETGKAKAASRWRRRRGR
ncbi:hypothetical protein [Variovorax paradoxus]|uniref:hypothetical protein n=1 Tax=Variovorax paradoxus TaxID=34073 RepID=UPI003D6499A1